MQEAPVGVTPTPRGSTPHEPQTRPTVPNNLVRTRAITSGGSGVRPRHDRHSLHGTHASRSSPFVVLVALLAFVAGCAFTLGLAVLARSTWNHGPRATAAQLTTGR